MFQGVSPCWAFSARISATVGRGFGGFFASAGNASSAESASGPPDAEAPLVEQYISMAQVATLPRDPPVQRGVVDGAGVN